MADPRHDAAPADPFVAADGAVLLTQTDFDTLVRELEALRSKHRGELAGRLREARAFGTSSENDDLLAALEESAVDSARVAKLEQLVRLAVVVEGSSGDGAAGLGATVRVVDEEGRTTDYDLIGRRRQGSERREVTLASPVGKALWGARPGDVVRVELPNGRDRTLRVLDVRHRQLAAESVIRAA